MCACVCCTNVNMGVSVRVKYVLVFNLVMFLRWLCVLVEMCVKQTVRLGAALWPASTRYVEQCFIRTSMASRRTNQNAGRRWLDHNATSAAVPFHKTHSNVSAARCVKSQFVTFINWFSTGCVAV